MLAVIDHKAFDRIAAHVVETRKTAKILAGGGAPRDCPCTFMAER